MRIRRGKVSDAEAIAAIQVRGWHAAYRDVMPKDHLDNMTVETRGPIWRKILADGVTLVAQVDEDVTGFCSVGEARDDTSDSSKVGEIYALYVEPQLWRDGVGTMLCRAGMEWLKGEGFRAISLWVLEDNRIGRGFYEKIGFQADGHTQLYQAGDRQLQELRYKIEN